MDLLARRYRVLAPDSYGSGKTAEWPSASVIRLQDELNLLAPLFAGAGESFALVGHCMAQQSHFWRRFVILGAFEHLCCTNSRCLRLWMPSDHHPNGADGIRDAVLAAGAALDAGDKTLAARHFIDFWMGSGSWDMTPEQRKPAIAASVVNIRRWAHALFTEPTPAQAFAALDVPVLYMLGDNSPESAHAVASILLPVLSRVEVIRFPGLGHMGPLTHPEIVNAEIARFLSNV